MKRTLLLTLSVLVLALVVCGGAMAVLDGVVDEALSLRSLSVQAAEAGDAEAAGEALARLSRLWREREGLLELLAEHDALHEVSAAIAEAQICLDCDDHDDFLRTMSQAKLALQHLKDEEALRWENLY